MLDPCFLSTNLIYSNPNFTELKKMKRETEGEDDILVMVEFHLSTQLRHRPGLRDMAMEKTHLTPNTKPQATSYHTKDTNLII